MRFGLFIIFFQLCFFTHAHIVHLDLFNVGQHVNGTTNVFIGVYDIHSDVSRILQSLATIYGEDSKQVIFADFNQKDLQELFYRNGLFLVDNQTNQTLTQFLNQPSPKFLVVPYVKQDRTCLLNIHPSVLLEQGILSAELTLIPYTGAADLASLVQFVNTHCGTERNVDGSLTLSGSAKKHVLENLFQYYSYPPEEESNEEFKCEKIQIPTYEQFLKEYVAKSRPVIIDGAMQHWPAIEKWTNEFLRSKFGRNEVHLKVAPGGEFEGCEDINLWQQRGKAIPDVVRNQLVDDSIVVVRPANMKIGFNEFMDLLKKNHTNENRPSYYLEYASIASQLPAMIDDIVTDFPWASFLKKEHMNIWIGDGTTLGKLHFDPFENLLCQIAGEKSLLIYPPYHNEDLYEGHIREAEFDFDPKTETFYRNRLLDSTSMVMSPVNIKSPDYVKYPKFRNTRPYNCTIKAGEILYLPSFWWHEVQSRPDAYRRNIAVNYWYTPVLNKEFPCKECNLFFNTEAYEHLLPELYREHCAEDINSLSYLQ